MSQFGTLRREQIEQLMTEAGLARFGLAELIRPFSMDVYEQWLKKNYHGEMTYLATHAPMKAEPQKILPQAKSAIVVTVDYLPHPEPHASPINHLQIASYARGQDYHHWLKQRLQKAVALLKVQFPEAEFLTFTDSSPVLERDLAYRAGLGWVGKNTCLINRQHGSLFFIGEIFTSLEIAAPVSPATDHCGTCRRCIDICPTEALTAPRELDARKCISYLTIEAKTAPPQALREKIGDWFFGCDLCQSICPWNLKFHKEHLQATVAPRELLIQDLRYILNISNKALGKHFLGSPLSRAGGNGLKRNAMIVAANQLLRELREEIQVYLEHEKLGEIAKWAIKKLN